MLLRTLRAHRGRVLASGTLLAMHQLAEASVPVLVGLAIDRAVATGDGSSLLFWILVLAALFTALSTCWRSGFYVNEQAHFGATHRIRLTAAQRVLHPGGGAEAWGSPGELVGLSTSDADRAALVCQAVGFAMAAIVVLTGGAVLLLLTSVQLGLVVLAGVVLVIAASRALSRPLVGRAENEQATLARASAVAADLVGGLRVLKGIQAQNAASQRYHEASTRSLAARMSAARFESVYEGATLALSGLFLVVVAWTGGRLAIQGDITVGELVAAFGLAQFLVDPMDRLTHVAVLLARSRASSNRLEELHATPFAVAPGTGVLPSNLKGELLLDGIHHGGLTDLRLHIAAGEHVGVVVTDPADAAALLAVLAREVSAEGRFELDGTALPDLDLEAVRRAVLVAPHHPELFEGTLADNVAAGAADRPIGPALDASAAAEVAETLPDGVDTELTESGRSVSGGQRQRIALARALAADPPVLVLHDPTTAVDPATEHRIASGLQELRRGRTTVLVTSSPALLARCDRVHLLTDGRIVASGPHTELAEATDGYRATVFA